MNVCWFCLKWGLLLAVIAAAVTAACLYRRVDEEIRRTVQQRIAQHYTNLKVGVRSAELVKGKGIELRGLSIVEPGAEGPRAELLHCDEVFLSCATDLPELLRGEPQITRVTIRRPTLRITRRPDGTWSAAKLFPLPSLCTHPPELTIEDGTVEIFDPLKTPSSTLTLRGVCGTLSPPDPASPNPQARKFRATLSADHVRGVVLEGQVDPRSLQWSIGGTIEGLDISPELGDAMPEPLATKLAVLRELRGQGTLRFRASYDPAAKSPYQFGVSGQLVRGRLDDPRLPGPLTELRATFRVSNEGVVIDELVARSGAAALRIPSARQAGFELGHDPLWITAEIRQLELDRQLLQRLPQALQDQWQQYGPEGQVNADVKLHFDGQTWHPDLSAECLNVSLSYHKFPYRLEHGTGSLSWKETPQGNSLEAHLTAYSGSQPVRLDAQVLRQDAGPSGWFEASGEDLQLDKKLLDAMNEPSRAVVSSLHPSGTINCRVRIWRDAPGEPLHKRFVIGLNHCSMRYERFPYPLGNVCGTLEMYDDDWRFHELAGTNDTGRVVCEEGWLTSPQRGREFYLRLVGTNVPLEEELRDALRSDIQRAWNNLRPRGTVDLAADVHYLPAEKKLSVGVTAYPQSDSASIEPVHFPYRLEKLQGALIYRDGKVTFRGRNPRERFKAEHGPVKIAATGDCDFLPDGRWSLRLEGLTADGLRPDDRDLFQALPGRLKKAVVELKPVGPVNLHGTLTLQGGMGEGRGARGEGRGISEAGHAPLSTIHYPLSTIPVQASWDLTAVFRPLPAASIDCGVKLENLSGSVTLAGASDGQHFYSRGELAIDSLTYKDYQLTQLMGPLWIDDQQVLLGSWVDRQQGEGPGTRGQGTGVRGQGTGARGEGRGARDEGREVLQPSLSTAHYPLSTIHYPPSSPRQPRPLTAKLFGGNVYGDGWIMLGPDPRYGLRATLSQADLSRLAQEVLAGRQNLQGKVTATVNLRGAGRSLNGLGGQGTIQLREGNVYELPLMIALLKIISIRPPDQTAFSTADVDFRIEGEHIYFDPINFNGDAISLRGAGEMDFQQSIRLTFHAIVGRGTWNIPLVKELFSGASQQIMQIHAGGTLQDPEIRKEPFPVVGQALQLLQGDPQGGGNAQSHYPQTRQWMPK